MWSRRNRPTTSVAAGSTRGPSPARAARRTARARGDLAAGLGRVVLIDPRQDEHRRAGEPHLVPGRADCEAGGHIAVANASISSMPRSSRLLSSYSPHCFQMLSNSSRLLSMIPPAARGRPRRPVPVRAGTT